MWAKLHVFLYTMVNPIYHCHHYCHHRLHRLHRLLEQPHAPNLVLLIVGKEQLLKCLPFHINSGCESNFNRSFFSSASFKTVLLLTASFAFWETGGGGGGGGTGWWLLLKLLLGECSLLLMCNVSEKWNVPHKLSKHWEQFTTIKNLYNLIIPKI